MINSTDDDTVVHDNDDNSSSPDKIKAVASKVESDNVKNSTTKDSLNKLNNEQLKEYVKKLLVKLRRLEQQQQQQQPNKVHDAVYWELISRSSPLQQRVAAAALAPIVKFLSRGPLPLKDIFKKWKVRINLTFRDCVIF